MKKDAHERGTGLASSSVQPGRAQADSGFDGDTESVDDFWHGGDAVYLRHLEAQQPSAVRSWARLQSRLKRRARDR